MGKAVCKMLIERVKTVDGVATSESSLRCTEIHGEAVEIRWPAQRFGRVMKTRMWSALLSALLEVAALACGPVHAQQRPVERATGTLAKVQRAGAITIGYRDASLPFSFLNARMEPVGYSVELCRELVTAIEDAVNKSLVIRWAPVTSGSRVDAVEGGEVDLECGSTSVTPERQKRVSFSPIIFVSGTKLLVRKASSIKSSRDLAGRRVAVIAGTTNEKALRALSDQVKPGIKLLAARDRIESFELLKSGQVDAFASDDVLLHGLIAQEAAKAEYAVTRDYLSFESYGIMYRKQDTQLRNLIDETFRVLAEDGEIERQYRRWFLRALPTGESLNLPMSARLEAIIQTMATKGRAGRRP